MGEPKALADLGGAPLIARPLAAASAFETVVVAKAGTPLPEGLVVWHEPDEPVHPLLGVITALERADGPVVAVPCDMPFVTAELLSRLAAGGAVRAAGRLQPFPARFEPEWLPALHDALAREAGGPRDARSPCPGDDRVGRGGAAQREHARGARSRAGRAA